MKKFFPAFINHINLSVAILLTITLLFSFSSLTRSIYYLFFCSYVIEIFTDRKWQNFRFDKIKLYYLVMALFFLLMFIYMPFEKTDKYTNIMLEKRAGLIGFAVIGFFGVNHLYRFKYFLYTFILTSVTAIVYLLFFRVGIYEFISSTNRVDLFTEMRTLYVSNHIQFNFYLNISIISIWYMLRKNWMMLSIWKRAASIAILVIIFSVLLISEGRAGFMAAVILGLIFIFIEIYNKHKTVGVIFAVILPLLFIGMVSTQRRFTEKLIENDPRTFLWKAGWEVVLERPLLGHGARDAQAAFDIKRTLYQSEDFRLYTLDKEPMYQDSHNQYLQAIMEFGILGLAMLLFLYLYPVYIADKSRKHFNVFIVFLCMFLSIFDMVVTRNVTPLFGLLTLIMLVIPDESGTKKLSV